MKKGLLILILAVVFMVTGCARETTEMPQASPEAVEVTTEEDENFTAEDDGSEWNDYMTSIEEQSDLIKTSLEQEVLTQADMNEKSLELYELWDGALNCLWGELKNSLAEDEFSKLLDEQRIWIREKENAVEEAGKEFVGGSMYALVVNGEAAKITEERVYQLYEIIVHK